MNRQPTSRLNSAVAATALMFASFVVAGCGTTTQRFGTEQLLLSDAVDNAISQIDFGGLSDQRVFLDTQFLVTAKLSEPVNVNYIISSLRQQMIAANCLLQDTKEDADIIVEPRVGALGADEHDVTFGIPQSNALSSAASVMSSSPIPSLPEISIGRRDSQAAVAKVAVFAYYRDTREPIWQSGTAKAESNCKNTWFLGIGPFQRGTIYDGSRFAGNSLGERSKSSSKIAEADLRVPHQAEFYFPREEKPSRVAQVPDEIGDQSDEGSGSLENR